MESRLGRELDGVGVEDIMALKARNIVMSFHAQSRDTTPELCQAAVSSASRLVLMEPATGLRASMDIEGVKLASLPYHQHDLLSEYEGPRRRAGVEGDRAR